MQHDDEELIHTPLGHIPTRAHGSAHPSTDYHYGFVGLFNGHIVLQDLKTERYFCAAGYTTHEHCNFSVQTEHRVVIKKEFKKEICTFVHGQRLFTIDGLEINPNEIRGGL